MTSTNLGYKICLDKWGALQTEQFCQEMGINSEFVDLLIQHVDSPCEGEFLNEYSFDDVLEEVRSERQQDEGQSMNKEVN